MTCYWKAKEDVVAEECSRNKRCNDDQVLCNDHHAGWAGLWLGAKARPSKEEAGHTLAENGSLWHLAGEQSVPHEKRRQGI